MEKLKWNRKYTAKVTKIEVKKDVSAIVRIVIPGFEGLHKDYCPKYNLANSKGKSLWERIESEVKVGDEISVKFEKAVTSRGTEMANCSINLDDKYFEDEDDDDTDVNSVFEGLDD